MSRRCNSCQACCTIVPVRAIEKPANTRCKHQRFGKGCAIYAHRQIDCALWQCGWLAELSGTGFLRRPDIAGWVIDTMPDVIGFTPAGSDERTELTCMQIWIDPKRPEINETDPALRRYIEHVAAAYSMPTLLRYGSEIARAVFPPGINQDAEWVAVEAPTDPAFGLYSKLAGATA